MFGVSVHTRPGMQECTSCLPDKSVDAAFGWEVNSWAWLWMAALSWEVDSRAW